MQHESAQCTITYDYCNEVSAENKNITCINIICDILIYAMKQDVTYKSKIGKLIQAVRHERGFTQQALAKALSTSQSAINRIENGGQNLSMEMLARISDVLNQEIVT